MTRFSGATADTEPLVGEVLGLRTFRVDDSGWLLPLYSDGCWYDGPNTAVCSPPTGDWRSHSHPVPAEDCECGFYAYGTPGAAQQNRSVRHVQAVVSCWGGVLAGTQGLRAQHARIDAIWLGPQAPLWLRRRVARRYPSARMFADADLMLAEYPPTPLRCYEPPPRRRVLPRVGGALALGLVFALGAFPAHTLHATAALWLSWLVVTAVCGGLGLWFLLGTDSIGHVSAAAISLAVLLWLLAPLFGVFGWLLRLPVLQAALVSGVRYLFGLLPRHFPIVRTRDRSYRAYRGVPV